MQHFALPLMLPTSLGVAVFAVWLFLFVLGREQLKRVQRRTQALAVDLARQELGKNKQLTLERFYTMFLPAWQQMLGRTAWFVTHKTELFPIPARPGLVMKRMGLDEAYVGRVLLEDGIDLSGYKFQRVRRKSAAKQRKRPGG